MDTMFLKDKKMMKIQKRKGKLLSPRRSIIEQTRIRQSFERKLVSDLIKFFERNGQIASQQFIDGQMRVAIMLMLTLSQILLLIIGQLLYQWQIGLYSQKGLILKDLFKIYNDLYDFKNHTNF